MPINDDDDDDNNGDEEKPKECPPNQHLEGDTCVWDDCDIKGQTRDNDGVCHCPPEQVIENNACTPCPKEQHYENGACVWDECPKTGQDRVNGICKCPDGYTETATACELDDDNTNNQDCQDGYFWNGSECEPEPQPEPNYPSIDMPNTDFFIDIYKNKETGEYSFYAWGSVSNNWDATEHPWANITGELAYKIDNMQIIVEGNMPNGEHFVISDSSKIEESKYIGGYYPIDIGTEHSTYNSDYEEVFSTGTYSYHEYSNPVTGNEELYREAITVYVVLNGGDILVYNPLQVELDIGRNENNFTLGKYFLVTKEGEIYKQNSGIGGMLGGTIVSVSKYYPTLDQALNLPQHIKDLIEYD